VGRRAGLDRCGKSRPHRDSIPGPSSRPVRESLNSYVRPVKGNCKGKVHPITGHVDSQGEWRYSSTLSLTSVLDGTGSQRQAPAVNPRERDSVPIV